MLTKQESLPNQSMSEVLLKADTLEDQMKIDWFIKYGNEHALNQLENENATTLKAQLKEMIAERDDYKEELSDSQDEVERLEQKLEDAHDEEIDLPSLLDQMKHEAFMNNYEKFTLEQFESFLSDPARIVLETTIANNLKKQKKVKVIITPEEKDRKRKLKNLSSRIKTLINEKGLRAAELQLEHLETHPEAELLTELNHQDHILAYKAVIEKHKQHLLSKQEVNN